MNLSERQEGINKQIAVIRKTLELLELDDAEFYKSYAHAVIIQAASLSIITSIQYYRGYQVGGEDTAKIYRKGT